MKESIKTYVRDISAVILGIFITFTIQGMIDRSSDRKNARSSLGLVRAELLQNLEDIAIMKEFMRTEKSSAEYFLSYKDSLDKCPRDSVYEYYSSMLFADVSFTLCEDALELLKMSSVFQKIGNNELSMKIIRAYDSCSSIVGNLNRHFSMRDARFENSIDKETSGLFARSGGIDIKKYLQTDYGYYAIKWIAVQPEPEAFMAVSDLEDAISAIDSYLGIPKKEAPKETSLEQGEKLQDSLPINQ